MLIAIVALVSTLGAFQDAPPATDPVVAAPSAKTSEKLLAYLKQAESRLYDPQAAGLRSLEFDLPVEMPGYGKLGSVHVTWTAGGQVTMDVTQAEGLELPADIPANVVEMLGQQSATEVINAMLNRPISMLLDSGVATLVGAEGGLVRVDFDAPEGRQAGVQRQSYFFDEDGLLRRSVTVTEMPNMMGGTMTVTANQEFAWKPATADSPLLIPDTQSVEADLGLTVQRVTVSFSYSTIDGVVVASGIERDSGGTQRQALAVSNLIVNGKTAATAAAPPANPPPDDS